MKYDVIVIGGGPAGMMAAGRAGEKGARVLLLEKNASLGIKLLITGNGRCNVTNNAHDARGLVEKYGKNGKFLFSALHRFGVPELMAFFEGRGVELKTEDLGRVFPVSDKSRDILQAMLKYLEESGVTVKTGSSVKQIIAKENRSEKIVLQSGREATADKYIVCTGGRSFPATGSSGDAYEWLRSLGHRIVAPKPALAPIILGDSFVKSLEGLSLQGVNFSLYRNGKKIRRSAGDMIFTANGLSGPAIIDMSAAIGACLPDKTEIVLDFMPDSDEAGLDNALQALFKENNNKNLGNILSGIIAKRLLPVFAGLCGVDMEKKANLISRAERKALAGLLKKFKLEVKSVAGFERAMVTAGGVDIKEVDSRTMRSKLIGNLYLAGEILDIDGPSGGYNLQLCWSTGFAAGDNVME